MSGFESRCQRVGEEISRDFVEDLRGRKHGFLFLISLFYFSSHLYIFFFFLCLFSLHPLWSQLLIWFFFSPPEEFAFVLAVYISNPLVKALIGAALGHQSGSPPSPTQGAYKSVNFCVLPLSFPSCHTYPESPVPVLVDNKPFSTSMSQTGPTPRANTMHQLPCGWTLLAASNEVRCWYKSQSWLSADKMTTSTA